MPLLCTACITRLERALQSLPALYVRLHMELPNGNHRRLIEQPANPTPWKSRERHLPLRLPLLEHSSRCVSAVRNWGEVAVPDQIPTDPVRPGYLLQHLCQALLGDIQAAIRTRDESHYARKVWDVYRTARRLLQCEPLMRHLPDLCPVCDLRSMVYRGNGFVFCRSCSARWALHN